MKIIATIIYDLTQWKNTHEKYSNLMIENGLSIYMMINNIQNLGLNLLEGPPLECYFHLWADCMRIKLPRRVV